MLVLQAKVARLLGEPAEADRLADQILARRSPPPTGAERARAHLIKGEAACDGGDADGAEAQLELARAASPAASLAASGTQARVGAKGAARRGAGDASLQGAVAGLAGRTALLREDPASAAGHFDREAAMLREARQYRPMARALARAARAHRDAGQVGAAADRFHRAARSAFGQGDLPAARELIASAVASAEQAGDESLLERVRSLGAEIDSSAPEPPEPEPPEPEPPEPESPEPESPEPESPEPESPEPRGGSESAGLPESTGAVPAGAGAD